MLIISDFFFTFADDIKIPTIVFNANNVTTLSPHIDDTLVFSSVISNIGNAYNSTTGKFTTPVNGTYSFTVQLCAYNKAGQFNLVLDGNILTGLYVFSDNGYSTQSSTLSVFLKRGQNVWVRSADYCVNVCLAFQLARTGFPEV